ncbi:isochorismate synthase [Opitutus sp. ER46]|uniref:isochorismate synthase n=1 Tax=Opitutus sp. ER46 TaxID=2161864 RepID=UPI000D2F4EAE|nr:isochorismate synthase [Opitutus sp. ER46]PTX94184.1 isochorismate synthase [Opitutus sp. ER46]
MKILPLHPADNASPDALRAFLAQCREAARRAGRPQLVSISLAVEALDPLAVLESIFESTEPHFYAERPSTETAIAGAEVALRCEAAGPERFATVQRWVTETLEHTIAVGDVDAPFGGPHFFAGFGFADDAEPGQPFGPASVFVPRWQVSLAGATTTAVANLVVGPDEAIDPLTERVWRAHGKFRRFDYAAPSPAGATVRSRSRSARQSTEVGDYRAAVAKALTRIEAGGLNKIVLARARDVEADQPFHPLEMLNGLRQRFPDCYAFSFTNGRGPSFIGATPERLVRVSQGVLETEALAGSAARGQTATEDAALGAALARSEKDLREQRQVLDDIVARLSALGLKPTFPAQPQVRRLANVQHLQTPIRAELPTQVRLLDVVAAMHPTPAVGGNPRPVAVPLIRELEGFPRGLYAGALGWMNARGGGEFFVGIRSALVEGPHARVYAGAGIVAGSTPEKEYAETDLKFRAMLDAFGLT